jgi:hypothetical protein
MSDATQKVEPSAAELVDAELKDERIKFERAYSNWHAAMAAYYNPDGPDDDEIVDALAEKRSAAEMELLITPACQSWCVWMKWELLDYLVAEECLNIIPLALGAIKGDLLRLGIKE